MTTTQLANLSKKFLLYLTTFTVVLFGSADIRALAATAGCPDGMSQQDCAAILGPWENWVPLSTTCSATLSTSLLGSDNEQQAFNYFLQKGLPAAAAAGIVGNLMAESHVDPKLVQATPPFESDTMPADIRGSRGYGIAQWTSAGRQQGLLDMAQSEGKPESDLGVQLDYLWKEATGSYASVLANVKAAATPQDAAIQWMGPNTSGENDSGGFENPRTSTDHRDIRQQFAESAFTQYGGDAVTAGGAAAAVSSSNGCSATGSGQNTAFVDITNFSIFDQCDPAWGKDVYGGTGTICGNGCAPTAMATVITALTGITVTPDVTAAYADSQNQTEIVNGAAESKFSIAPVLADHWGLTATLIGSDVAKISATLQAGGLVVAGGKGPLPFTTDGHYIVIRGVTSDGNWVLADPYSGTGHSNTQEWNPQAVVAAGMITGSVYAITKTATN